MAARQALSVASTICWALWCSAVDFSKFEAGNSPGIDAHFLFGVGLVGLVKVGASFLQLGGGAGFFEARVFELIFGLGDAILGFLDVGGGVFAFGLEVEGAHAGDGLALLDLVADIGHEGLDIALGGGAESHHMLRANGACDGDDAGIGGERNGARPAQRSRGRAMAQPPCNRGSGPQD